LALVGGEHLGGRPGDEQSTVVVAPLGEELEEDRGVGEDVGRVAIDVVAGEQVVVEEARGAGARKT